MSNSKKHTTNNPLNVWIILTIVVSCIVIGLFVVKIIKSGEVFWKGGILYDVTGQVGDFIGGVIGTVFSAGAFLLMYLTLREQQKNYDEETFENRFMTYLELHRKNVEEIEFNAQKFYVDKGTMSVDAEFHRGRKAFYQFFKQINSCRNEISSILSSTKTDVLYTPKYLQEVSNLHFIKYHRIRDLKELAIIDIAYCIFFFGVGADGRRVLKNLFAGKYSDSVINMVLGYIALKPASNKTIYSKWESMRQIKDINRRLEVASAIEKNRNNQTYSRIYLLPQDEEIIKDYRSDFVKYYGGHQFCLGHYFRHLFQCVSYVNNQENLSYEQKYNHVKLLRAQLSTYEQTVLFFNSLSQLGRRWEMLPEVAGLSDEKRIDHELITKYCLIKNIPIGMQFGIEPSDYYKEVQYETPLSDVRRKEYH